MGWLGEMVAWQIDAERPLLDSDTLVNGEETSGQWEIAGAQKIQTYLDDSLWGKPTYEVALPAEVLGAPYHLAMGSFLRWVKRGGDFVVRWIETPPIRETLLQVIVLVQPTTHKG